VKLRFDESHDRTTKVFAIAGLDRRAIVSKSLIAFSCQGDGTLLSICSYLRQQIKINFGISLTECYYPAIANTDSLCVMLLGQF
jgi:hypothetical protein